MENPQDEILTESSQETQSDVALRRRWGCWSRLLVSGLAVLALAAIAIWLTLMAARDVPDFYAIALGTDMQQAKSDGRLFERNLIKLQNTARRRTPWIVEISEAHVNGWFASDLPEKFPESLPADIQDPRAVFTQDEIRIAFKYKVREFVGVVVISANVYCTEKANEIAVQINSVKTGFLPLPIGPWLERVADSIRNAGIPVFWTHADGVPVAIFTLPEHITTTSTNHVIVEAIDLRPGKLVIAGNTTKTVDEKQQENLEAEKKAKSKRIQKLKNNKSNPPRSANRIRPAKD